jgi:hypothetical protein
VLSAWRAEARSALAAYFGELHAAGHGSAAAPALFPVGAPLSLSLFLLALISAIHLGSNGPDRPIPLRGSFFKETLDFLELEPVVSAEFKSDFFLFILIR